MVTEKKTDKQTDKETEQYYDIKNNKKTYERIDYKELTKTTEVLTNGTVNGSVTITDRSIPLSTSEIISSEIITNLEPDSNEKIEIDENEIMDMITPIIIELNGIKIQLI